MNKKELRETNVPIPNSLQIGWLRAILLVSVIRGASSEFMTAGVIAAFPAGPIPTAVIRGESPDRGKLPVHREDDV